GARRGGGARLRCTPGVPSRGSCDLLSRSCPEECAGKAQTPARFVYSDRAEPERLPGPELPDASDVERADGRDLRIAAGGLAVNQEDDRLAVTGHLDRAEGDTVREDVVATQVCDPRAGVPRAHADRLRQHRG